MILTLETIRVLVETPEIHLAQEAARAVDSDREIHLAREVARADLDKATRGSDRATRAVLVKADLVRATGSDRAVDLDRATGSDRAVALVKVDSDRVAALVKVDSDRAVASGTIYLTVAIRLVDHRLITIHNLSSTNLITWIKP